MGRFKIEAKDDELDTLVNLEPKDNSMRFATQKLTFALEYKSNKILLTVDPTGILITENWQLLRRISNGSENNMSQNYLHRHPEFDIVKFPFVVVSGLEHFSLVNVKDFFAQEFIASSCNMHRGSRAFFFKKEKYGQSFHFSSFELAASNVVHHKWHEMQLKHDYFEKLRQYGLLPDSNLNKKFKMMESYANYNKKKQEQFPDKETQNISYKTKEILQ